MIKVLVGNTGGVETKQYGTLSDFRFALSMIKRDRRYTFVFASTDRGVFYGAMRGGDGETAALRWGQAERINKLGLRASYLPDSSAPWRKGRRAAPLSDTEQCYICKLTVTPLMGYCPYCECNLTNR